MEGPKIKAGTIVSCLGVFLGLKGQMDGWMDGHG